MKSKTSYLFGEKTNYEKCLKKFKGSESIFELFNSYYLQLDLMKYKLFGEDYENYGDLKIHGESYSPSKINLDVLENYLSDVKLFQEIFINDNKQQKTTRWVNPSKNDIKEFLKILNIKNAPLNFFKIKKMPKLTYNKVIKSERGKNIRNNNSKNTNINENMKYNKNISRNNNLKNLSTEKSSNLSCLQINSSITNKNKKLPLSPVLTCRHKLKNKINEENNIIKEYNSFYCPYEKKCVPNKFILLSKRKNLNKRSLSDKFDKIDCMRKKRENNKRVEEILLMKNKLNALEKKAKIDSNNFIYKILKRDEQKPQLKLRFNYLMSQCK